MRATVALAVCFLVATSAASAEPTPELAAPAQSKQAKECAESFPARLADAKDAFREHLRQEARAKPAAATVAKLEWFDAHCRFLSPLEIAVRKLDDPNSFVCDPAAKGRPKGLTTALVVNRPEAESAWSLQKLGGDSALCHDYDQAERVVVALDGWDNRTQLEQLAFLCYGDESAKCTRAHEILAAAKAKSGQ